MAIKILDPYVDSHEKLVKFRIDIVEADVIDAAKSSVDRFGHAILGLPLPISLEGLKIYLANAVDGYLATDEALIDGFQSRVDEFWRCQPHQLGIDYTNCRPSSIPSNIGRTPPDCSRGVFPAIRTNDLADYVAFCSRPAPAFRYDGSLRSDVSIGSLVIAPFNTDRARRIFTGVFGPLIDELNVEPIST